MNETTKDYIKNRITILENYISNDNIELREYDVILKRINNHKKEIKELRQDLERE